MQSSRREFLTKVAAAATTWSLGSNQWVRGYNHKYKEYQSKPWIELSKSTYLHNAGLISQMVEGKPIIAVLKNNAYGLGGTEVAQILDSSDHIFSLAVVKDESALAIRKSGVLKPILLMGDFDQGLSQQLIEENITLSIYSYSSLQKIKKAADTSGRVVKVALYIDTGLGRMGIPWQKATSLAKEIIKVPDLTISQTFSTLTTPEGFALEQINRFKKVTDQMDKLGIPTGIKHLAPSYSLLSIPESHQDAVRPGILIHGTFPKGGMDQVKRYPLKVPYRLKAPVIRLEKLTTGDTIGFSRFYKVQKDEWIATLPIGWADGYDSGAETGAKVLLKDNLYSVVNVNASHTNVSLGAETSIGVGDVATLIGPEAAEITPEGFGKLAGGHNYLQIYYKESLTKHVYEAF